MNNKLIKGLFTPLVTVLLVSCANHTTTPPSTKQTTKSSTENSSAQTGIDWVSVAPEYNAGTHQAYRAASEQLNTRLKSKDSAVTEVDAASTKNKKPAIILDVDETILSNLVAQEAFAKNGGYSEKIWNAWVQRAEAPPLAGSVEFLQAAAKQGVTIFYVTNRKASQEDATRRNLRKFGYPISDKVDTVLLQDEKPDWTSDKASRRIFVANDFHVIMLFGDDLNDFISAKQLSKKERDAAVEKYQDYWANKWFIMPNPMYGSWTMLIGGEDYN